MTYVDPYEHMEEAWKLEANPFPTEAIREEGQPFSPNVFPEESLDFKRKLVRGAILGSRGIGFLWSQGRKSDTGFGKTTLMMETVPKTALTMKSPSTRFISNRFGWIKPK